MPIGIVPRMACCRAGQLALSALVLTGGTWACAGSKESYPSREPIVYAMRGVVRQIEESQGKTILYIHHEAVDDFVDIQGRTVGMKPMTMPFVVDKTVSTPGVQVGDRVAFDLVVDWEGAEPARIRSLQILPPDTQLDFGSGE